MPVPGQPWIASGTLCRLGGVPEVSSLDLTPAGDDAIVTSGLLRRVSLTAITAAAQAEFDLIAAAEAELARTRGTEPRAHGRVLAGARPTGTGRRPLNPGLLRSEAEACLDGARSGRGMYRRLGERIEREHGRPFAETQVRHAIKRASEEGWLSAAGPGTIMRSAGPRLVAARRADAARPAAGTGSSGACPRVLS
jgi:hypothetical protein